MVAAVILLWVTALAANDTLSTNDGHSGWGDVTENSPGNEADASADEGKAPASSKFPDDTSDNPINLMIGNKFQKETDVELPDTHRVLNPCTTAPTTALVKE